MCDAGGGELAVVCVVVVVVVVAVWCDGWWWCVYGVRLWLAMMGVGGDSCFDGHKLKRNRHGQGTCSLAELLILTFPIGYHALVIDGSLALLAPDGMPTIIGCTHQTSIRLKNNTS